MQKKRTLLFLHHRVISPVKEFIQDSRAVGITLIVCTIVSLFISNSRYTSAYTAFWERHLQMPLPELHLPHTPLHLINDALMSVFFLLVGLEIKRELLVGELASVRKSMLPVAAALGGMVVPVVIFLLWCGGTPYESGWGIPMATDIAFSLGVLSLLGNRVPVSLKIFLTALAIIDDLGGILMIAIFYAGAINWLYLLLAGGMMLILTMMNILKVKRYFLYFIPGVILWYLVFNSGVHATIAGVLLAFTIPLHKIEDLEHSLHHPVNFIILPLFALANTAIMLPADFSIVLQSKLNYGVLSGLVLGKPIGIFLFSLAAIKLNIAERAKEINNNSLLGTGILAGIGFTMSIFITTLAFDDTSAQLIAKLSILLASFTAGTSGYLFLLLGSKKQSIITASK
ncbi:MAG TPA: Na+/H+ antiporter NhaA [Flavipsychrobacter sp.]|nr:Na+/H+ antiporter NhaA [Flavipsychrobacter sp.]